MCFNLNDSNKNPNNGNGLFALNASGLIGFFTKIFEWIRIVKNILNRNFDFL